MAKVCNINWLVQKWELINRDMSSASSRAFAKKRKGGQGGRVVKLKSRKAMKMTVAPAVAGAGGVERKSVDVNGSVAFPVNTAVTVTLLNGLATGTDYYNRTGRKVVGKSLRLRGDIKPTATTTNIYPGGFLRMAVVLDRQPDANPGSVTWADVFQNQDNAGTTSNQVTAGVNLNNRDRFKILRDKTFQVPTFYYQSVTPNANIFSGYPSLADGEQLCVDWFIPLQDLVTQYSGTGAMNITTGSLFIVSQSDQNTGVWTFNFSSRYRYTDN